MNIFNFILTDSLVAHAWMLHAVMPQVFTLDVGDAPTERWYIFGVGIYKNDNFTYSLSW